MTYAIRSLFCTAIVGICCLPPSANASDWSNAVDVCQGALPSFEGALRKRPLGIASEGTSAAFVTCSLRIGFSEDELAESVAVLFTNRASGQRSYSCTLVEGTVGTSPVYLPKEISMPGEGTRLIVTWDLDDNDGSPYVLPNLSCALPPGVEINYIRLTT